MHSTAKKSRKNEQRREKEQSMYREIQERP
jgi:hypothetical protein